MNPKYFDGTLLQVLGTSRNGHGGVTIHVQECAYRFFAVQTRGFECGVRPLGVKGIVQVGDKWLVGKRSQRVAAYQGLWEFVPGGGLESAADPVADFRRELVEETGVAMEEPSTTTPIAIALLDDPIARTWDIIYHCTLERADAFTPSFEHDALALLDREELHALTGASPAFTAMLPLVRELQGER